MAKEIKSGNRYAFIANEKSADFLFGKDEDEKLQSRKLKGMHGKYLETVEYNAFTFTTDGEGYTIQDAEGRFMYTNGNLLSFAKEKPATGAIWSVSINEGMATVTNGDNTLYYSKENECFACHSAKGEDMELPAIYMLREYPEYTITPGNKSELQSLQKITVTCEEGIKASDNLKLKASGNEIDATFSCNQIDDNTLEFTLKEPLTTTNNTYLWINMTGEIILCPEELGMEISATTLVNYTLIGNAEAATIESVVPANGEKVETLSYILFTFSYYTGKTDNTETYPKLYMEGSEENIPVEFTTDNEDGTGKVEHMQCALKVTEPVVKNGTYILEIPDGYFVDGNGRSVKGITLKYIVDNDGTGIEETVMENESYWVVYSLAGTRVLATDNAGKLMALPKGIYIVNGTKRIVR